MDFLDDRDAFINRLKRHPLPLSALAIRPADNGRELVRRLLPHRPPMEFIDAITAVDLPGRTLEASSWIAADAPVFAGHFPGDPVYPGIFQIETMGQAALCLAQFLRQGRVEAPAAPSPPSLFTRVHNAGFIRMIRAETLLAVRARVLAADDFVGLVAAQILEDGRICSHAVLEMYRPPDPSQGDQP